MVKNRSAASVVSAPMDVSVMKLLSEKEDVSLVWSESAGEASSVSEMRWESAER